MTEKAKKSTKRMVSKNPAGIKHVSFRSSIELKPYQHAHIEASADVSPNEDPAGVLDRLKVFVAEQLIFAKEGDKRPVAGRFSDLLTSKR